MSCIMRKLWYAIGGLNRVEKYFRTRDNRKIQSIDFGKIKGFVFMYKDRFFVSTLIKFNRNLVVSLILLQILFLEKGTSGQKLYKK